MTLEQYEIAVAIGGLMIGLLGVLYAKYLNYRLHRDDSKIPPAE